MNAQREHEKSARFLSGQLSKLEQTYKRLEKPFLQPTDYDELLATWVQKGSSNWIRKKKTRGALWRRSLVESLKDRVKWREIIEEGATRPTELEKEEIKQHLTQAGGDPLMFLNLVGVPPYEILTAFESQHDRQERWKSKLDKIRLEGGVESDAKLLNEAARLIHIYEWVFRDEIDERSFLPRKYWTASRVKVMAQLIKDAKKNDLVPPWTDSRGALPKEEFYRIVIVLKGICDSGISANRKKNKLLSISAAEKSLWGVITAILMAAFPKMIEKTKNPSRNVKNAYKRAIEINKEAVITRKDILMLDEILRSEEVS